MKLDRLLVPLDGSMLAETAMWTARDFADKYGATMILLRAAVAYPALGADKVAAEAVAIREAEKYLAAAARHLSSRGFERSSGTSGTERPPPPSSRRQKLTRPT